MEILKLSLALLNCSRQFLLKITEQKNLFILKIISIAPSFMCIVSLLYQYPRLNIKTKKFFSLIQLNEITPFIDGTLFYGPGKAWTDAIREFKHGYLKVRDPSTYNHTRKQFPADNDIRLPFANPPPPADHYLKPVNRFFSTFIQYI